MKILTLNTHSLMEDDYEKKCRIFAKAVLEKDIDILLLQEVNQSYFKKTVFSEGYAVGCIPIKEDNHALKVYNLINGDCARYNFAWLGIKSGFGKYDEGLAVMSKTPIEKAEEILLSKNDNYTDWKTRKALLVYTCGKWICNTHMGWWDDKEEPFKNQFEKLNLALKPHKDVILGGDFNSPDNQSGYNLVMSHGWHDTYMDAKEKSGYATINGKIAGWENNVKCIRVDYIFTKQKKNVSRSYTVFDSLNHDVISDHFGVISEFSEV